MEGWVGENVEPADESRFLSPHGGAEKTPEDVVAAQWAEAGGDEVCILTKYGKGKCLLLCLFNGGFSIQRLN